MTSRATSPQLVAHRGFPARYPENTLTGVRAAIEAGACHVEFDVQFSADGQPLVLHDDNLLRTAGIDQSVFALSMAQCRQISVHEPDRLGDRFAPQPVPPLREMLALVAQYPQVTAYVEVKQESIDHAGLHSVMQGLHAVLQEHARQCVVISFNADAVQWVQQHTTMAAGWVLEHYDDTHRHRAESLRPQWLICDQQQVNGQQRLWPGPWQWMLYGVETVGSVHDCARRGADAVETDAFGDLLQALQAPGAPHA